MFFILLLILTITVIVFNILLNIDRKCTNNLIIIKIPYNNSFQSSESPLITPTTPTPTTPTPTTPTPTIPTPANLTPLSTPMSLSAPTSTQIITSSTTNINTSTPIIPFTTSTIMQPTMTSTNITTGSINSSTTSSSKLNILTLEGTNGVPLVGITYRSDPLNIIPE